MGVKVQAQEGDTTIAMRAPADLKEGDIFTFFGFPMVALTDAKRGRRVGFQKRGTLRFAAPVLKALNGGNDIPLGPLTGEFEAVANAPGWRKLKTLVGGDVVVGLVEGFSSPPNFFDDVYLDLATGGGSGGGGSAGDYYDESATDARFDAVEAKNTSQDAKITATEQDVRDLDTAIDQLRTLVEAGGGGGGDGSVNLQPILDDIADLEAQSQALAAKNTTQDNAINALQGRATVLEGRVTTLENAGGGGSSGGSVQAMVFRQADYEAIAPGATKRIRFYTFQAAQPKSANLDPASNDANGYATRIRLPEATMYQIDVQLRPLPMAGQDVVEAGSFMAVSVVAHDDPALDFIGRLVNVPGFWTVRRLSTDVIGGGGYGFAIDVTNTHDTNTLYLDDAASAIIVRMAGTFA